MSAWRDAAEEAGAAEYFRAGAAGAPMHSQSFLFSAARLAYRAGLALSRSALPPPAPPSRLDVALAALKKAERCGDLLDPDGVCPCCGEQSVFRNAHHNGMRRPVTVKYAIAHNPDCQLAQALYGEWP